MSITCYVTVSGSQCCAIHLSKLKGSDGADVFVVFAISIYMSSLLLLLKRTVQQNRPFVMSQKAQLKWSRLVEVPTKHQHSELKSSEMLIKKCYTEGESTILFSADTWSFENDSREAPLVSVMKNNMTPLGAQDWRTERTLKRISECLE